MSIKQRHFSSQPSDPITTESSRNATEMLGKEITKVWWVESIDDWASCAGKTAEALLKKKGGTATNAELLLDQLARLGVDYGSKMLPTSG
jgi:hypothetical protein